MAYRTQSTRGQYRDVSPDKEDISYARELTAAATAFLGSELISLGKRNIERKQINNALMLQSEAKKAELMTNIGALATEQNGVNKASLKETSSVVVKKLTDAQLRVSQSTGTYRHTDPLTGEVRTREDDLKAIAQLNDFVNNIGGYIEANEALIGKLQEQLAMNNIGDHPGAVDMETVDPRLLAIALGDDPSKGIKFTETYDVDYDPEKGDMISVVYKGKGIEEANKALGISGDEFTVNAKSLAGILNDPERNPTNMYAYVSSNNYTGADNLFGKQATQVTAEGGLLRDNFYTPVGEKTINLGGNRRQLVDQKMLKYKQVHGALNGTSVAAGGSSMRGNNPQQVLTDIKAYTKYDEETKEHYYNTPKVGDDGLLQYNDKGEVVMNDERSVLIKDGQLMVDQAGLKDNLTEMYSQYQLGELGAYDKIRNIPIGNPYTLEATEGKPTEGIDYRITRGLKEEPSYIVDDHVIRFSGGNDLSIKTLKISEGDGEGQKEVEVFGLVKRDGKLQVRLSMDGETLNESRTMVNNYINALTEDVSKDEKQDILRAIRRLEKSEEVGSISTVKEEEKINKLIKETQLNSGKDYYYSDGLVTNLDRSLKNKLREKGYVISGDLEDFIDGSNLKDETIVNEITQKVITDNINKVVDDHGREGNQFKFDDSGKLIK